MRPPTARCTIGLLLLAAALRLPWLLIQPTDLDAIRDKLPDQAEYLELARNLLDSGALHFHDPRFPGDVHAFRMPGYPLFIAALGARPTLVRLAQVAIDCSTVLGVVLLARRWLPADARGPWGIPGPLLAGLAAAVNPWLVYFSALLLTETLFTAVLVWAMMLLSLRWPRRRAGMVVGIALLSLGIYIRPSALALPALLAFAAALANRPESRPYHSNTKLILREAVAIAALAAVITVAALAPWAIRNRLHPDVQRWIWTTTNAGLTAYDGFGPSATGASDQSFVRDMPELQRMDEVERSQHLGRLARRQMAADPLRTLALAGRKIARTWSPVPLSEQFSRLHYILPGLLYTAPLFLLAAAGLALAPMSRTAKLFLLGPAIYLTLIHALSVGSARYRIPADAPLAVLAAGALVRPDGRRAAPPAA